MAVHIIQVAGSPLFTSDQHPGFTDAYSPGGWGKQADLFFLVLGAQASGTIAGHIDIPLSTDTVTAKQYVRGSARTGTLSAGSPYEINCNPSAVEIAGIEYNTSNWVLHYSPPASFHLNYAQNERAIYVIA
jgi:hypothetical protein